MKTSRLLLATITMMGLPAVLFGQNSAGAVQPMRLPRLSPDTMRTVNRTAGAARSRNILTDKDRRFASIKQQIRFLNPAVSNDLLIRDEAVVRQTISEVVDGFKAAGFDEPDAEEAVLAAWFYIRIDTVIKVTVEILVGSTNDLGKLVINSDPDQAQIAVDGQATGYSTLYSNWLPAGTYRIRLSKRGYLPAEGYCKVLSRKRVEFVKTLTPSS